MGVRRRRRRERCLPWCAGLFHADGSAEDYHPSPTRKGGFAAAVVETIGAGNVRNVVAKEVEGKFHGPVAAELLGAYLAFREVERAIMEDDPVLRYKIGIDNSMVRAWCDGEAPIKNSLRYAVFIELVVTLLERINELAARNGGDVVVYHEPKKTNKAHKLAKKMLQNLRRRGFQAVSTIDGADVDVLTAIALVRD